MTKHTLNLLLAYEPKVPKSPEPLHPHYPRTSYLWPIRVDGKGR